jgi:hypothetical protein
MSFDDAMANVPILGDLFGSTARRAQRRADEVWNGVSSNMPTADELAWEATQQGGTEFDRIRADRVGSSAQAQALRQLQDRASGRDPVFDAAVANNRNQAQTEERAQRDAVQRNMEARGMGGSGAALAGALAAQQGGATRNHLGGLQASADTSMRALQAIQGAAALGGQMRGQGFTEQASRATAQDAINRFNSTQQSQTNQNRAGANQQEFDNRFNIAATRTAQDQAREAERAASQQSMWSSAVGLGATAMMGPAGGMAAGALMGGGKK